MPAFIPPVLKDHSQVFMLVPSPQPPFIIFYISKGNAINVVKRLLLSYVYCLTMHEEIAATFCKDVFPQHWSSPLGSTLALYFTQVLEECVLVIFGW